MKRTKPIGEQLNTGALALLDMPETGSTTSWVVELVLLMVPLYSIPILIAYVMFGGQP